MGIFSVEETILMWPLHSKYGHMFDDSPALVCKSVSGHLVLLDRKKIEHGGLSWTPYGQKYRWCVYDLSQSTYGEFHCYSSRRKAMERIEADCSVWPKMNPAKL